MRISEQKTRAKESDVVGECFISAQILPWTESRKKILSNSDLLAALFRLHLSNAHLDILILEIPQCTAISIEHPCYFTTGFKDSRRLLKRELLDSSFIKNA